MSPRAYAFSTTALAGALLVLGFFVGYGYHSQQSDVKVAPTPVSESPSPPFVKGLRASPNGKLLAFSAVYGDPPVATRFVLNVQTKSVRSSDTPRGWQDYTMQWSDDSSKVLFNRERIPRDVAKTTTGLYEEAQKPDGTVADAVPLNGTAGLPTGQKSYAGFWMKDGRLAIKTRGEPKSIYIAGDKAFRIDGTEGTYLQNRPVRENGRSVLYVVRDIPGHSDDQALFRIEGNGPARQVGESLGSGVVWCYVSEGGQWFIVCRKARNGQDWNWTLCKISNGHSVRVTARDVPSDVVSVYWSPDGRSIFGASGRSLWLVDVPSLLSRKLGTREDWNADDAAWTIPGKEAVIASKGTLWSVDTVSGLTQVLWKFPNKYWK